MVYDLPRRLRSRLMAAKSAPENMYNIKNINTFKGAARAQGCELRSAAAEPAESQVTGRPAICIASSVYACDLSSSGFLPSGRSG